MFRFSPGVAKRVREGNNIALFLSVPLAVFMWFIVALFLSSFWSGFLVAVYIVGGSVVFAFVVAIAPQMVAGFFIGLFLGWPLILVLKWLGIHLAPDWLVMFVTSVAGLVIGLVRGLAKNR